MTEPKKELLPFAHEIQSLAIQLIDTCPHFFSHSRHLDTSSIMLLVRGNGRTGAIGVDVFDDFDRFYETEFNLDVIAHTIKNGDLPIKPSDQPQARSILHRKAGLYVVSSEQQLAQISLGLLESYPRLETGIKQEIAALRKFQRGLLERAAPTPAQMRK